MVNRIFILLLSVCLLSESSAQELKHLTLDEAYNMSRANYPAIQQQQLVQQTNQLTLRNLAAGYLPQFSINGQASYQSDVTRVNIPIPGIEIPSPNKDQYKLTADLNQTLFDGGVIKQQRQLQQLNAEADQQQVEVDLYAIRSRINDLYLGALLLDEQLKLVELVRNDLQNGVDKVAAQVNNGVAFRSNLNSIKAELLKTDQRAIELKAARRGFLRALAIFLHQPVSDSAELELPFQRESADTIARPEIKLFEERSRMLGQQSKLIHARNLPKAGLFLQGGYGRPGLNMLDNNFDFFYIGGLRFNWAFGGLYTKKNDLQLVKINQKNINVQKETFLLNTKAQLTQQQSDIEKLTALIATDTAIISLRKSVKDAARAQLDNAVITASDYLREVNAEDQARQTLATHQLQLMQAKINYQTISGN